jgi:hypothetical protein
VLLTIVSATFVFLVIPQIFWLVPYCGVNLLTNFFLAEKVDSEGCIVAALLVQLAMPTAVMGASPEA